MSLDRILHPAAPNHDSEPVRSKDEDVSRGPMPLSPAQERRMYDSIAAPVALKVDFSLDALRNEKAQLAAMQNLTTRSGGLQTQLRTLNTSTDGPAGDGPLTERLGKILSDVDRWIADTKVLISAGDFMHDGVKAALTTLARAAFNLSIALQQTIRLLDSPPLQAQVKQRDGEVQAVKHGLEAISNKLGAA